VLGDHLFGVDKLWHFSGSVFNIAVLNGGQIMENMMIVTSQGLCHRWSMYNNGCWIGEFCLRM